MDSVCVLFRSTFVFCFLHLAAFAEIQNGGLVPLAVDSGARWSDGGRLDVLKEASSVLSGLEAGKGVCGVESGEVLKAAEALETWGLRVLDSTAKLPSGILNGNLNQYGDFDECLSADSQTRTKRIRGKYCLANIGIRMNRSAVGSRWGNIDDLIHAHRGMTSELEDPGHRIPKLGSFNWGVCIPSSCSSANLEESLNIHLESRVTNPDIKISAVVDSQLCYTKEKPNFTLTTYLAILFFGFTTLLTVTATFDNENLPKLIGCFSLKRNLKAFLNSTPAKDDIPALHGIRALNALALLLSHKQMAQMYNPIINRTMMSETLGGTWSMIGRSAILYTDTFILISGLLAAYSFVKELDLKKKISVKEKYISRFIRFTPNLFAIVMFCTYILPYLGSGPQWGLVVDRYASLCKQNMWRNFLYIHNYFGFEDMCLTHTHQLGIDMQMYLVSPLLVYYLWRRPKSGMALLVVIATASTLLRYSVTLNLGLSTVIHFGISVSRLFKTAKFSYILPTHRATVYAIGLGLGFYLRRAGGRLNLRPVQVLTGWVLAVGLGLLAMFGPYHTADPHYTYQAMDAAMYNAFSPLAWSAFVGWVILASANGFGGWFCEFLSWKYFLVFSRMAYALYLTQFPIFFFNVGSERSGLFYRGLHSLVDLGEFTAIIAASVGMTLLFDMPAQNMLREWRTRKIGVVKREDVGNNNEKTVEENGVDRRTEKRDIEVKTEQTMTLERTMQRRTVRHG